jgi:hypothetical protein
MLFRSKNSQIVNIVDGSTLIDWIDVMNFKLSALTCLAYSYPFECALFLTQQS